MAKLLKPRLSKSHLLAFKQCPKRLWLQQHQPDSGSPGGEAKAAFFVGNQVGKAARAMLPDGVLIKHHDKPHLALAKTERWLARDWMRDYWVGALYEAAFEYDGVLVRVDVLIQVRSGNTMSYRVCEVKSTAGIKERHFFDAAIQKWVIQNSTGFPIDIKRTELVCINTDYVHVEDWDESQYFTGLFKSYRVDKAIQREVDGMPAVVAAARKTLKGKLPKIEMGNQCTEPYACEFMEHCAKSAPKPPLYPVTLLPRGQVLAAQLTEEGYADLRKVPAKRMDSVKNAIHKRVHAVSVSGKPYLSTDAAGVLAALPYPRFYLDFETIGATVPIWTGTRPFEPVPFQWSCHIETAPGKFTHKELLLGGGEYPVPELAQELLSMLGKEGAIFVYSPYESRILRDIARLLPKLAKPLEAVRARLFDLLPFTREHFYHPKMRGSWSMKDVLPAIAPALDYQGLKEVRNGTDAQLAFMEARECFQTRRLKALRRHMLAYCKRDTLALVRLVQTLEGKSRRKAARRSLTTKGFRPLPP